MSDNIKGMGFLPSPPDFRDLEFKVTAPILIDLPEEVDLRKVHPLPTINQYSLGSCVAHASAHAHLYEQLRQGYKNPFGPSRLFIYYNCRMLMGKQYLGIDSGSYLRLGVKALAKYGAPPDREYPYLPKSFKLKPPQKLYSKAEKHQALVYRRVDQRMDQMKGCLASGHPFILGFSVYDSFNDVGRNGIVPLPSSDESFRGGHAVICVGYTAEHFIVQNSWSKSWGDQGFCYFPHSYLTNPNLATDFWMLELIE